MTELIPLGKAGDSCGAKAATLGRLLGAGFAVPDGFVVAHAAADGWQQGIPAALHRLGGDRFAVRSSAFDEDGREASFAGQYRTVLDVAADQLAEQVRHVAASGPDAAAYAAATGRGVRRNVPVLVQPMLASVAAGVAFTRHPVTGRRAAVLEAVSGLGERLVSGQTAPQRWQTGKHGKLTASGTPGVLTAGQAAAVVGVAAQVEELLCGGQDVEWALTDDGRVWVLQARPITTTPSLSRAPQARGHVLAAGVAASPGTARGRLRVIGGLDDFASFNTGDVLVCRATSPAWTPLLARASAVVTETGGILAHAAIVARELRIPAVTDVPAATALPDRAAVVVDGTAGTISRLTEGQDA